MTNKVNLKNLFVEEITTRVNFNWGVKDSVTGEFVRICESKKEAEAALEALTKLPAAARPEDEMKARMARKKAYWEKLKKNDKALWEKVKKDDPKTFKMVQKLLGGK